MKKFMIWIACFALLAGQVSYAQVSDSNTKKSGVSDKENNKIAQSDLEQRFPGVNEQPVTWDHGKSGNNTAYFIIDDNEYMAEYDVKGNWVRTFEKKEWKTDVPSNVRKNYEENYKDRKIDSYWEISDSKDKGQDSYLFYYNDGNEGVRNFEMDDEGNVTGEDQYNYPGQK